MKLTGISIEFRGPGKGIHRLWTDDLGYLPSLPARDADEIIPAPDYSQPVRQHRVPFSDFDPDLPHRFVPDPDHPHGDYGLCCDLPKGARVHARPADTFGRSAEERAYIANTRAYDPARYPDGWTPWDGSSASSPSVRLPYVQGPDATPTGYVVLPSWPLGFDQ